MAHINCQSARSKIDSLKHYVSESKFDIFTLSESWFTLYLYLGKTPKNHSMSYILLVDLMLIIIKNPLPIKIDNEQIQYVDSYKYLGVTLDQGLNFNLHTQNKLSSHKVYMLSGIRPYITKDAALKIYKSKICPYMDYGDIL